MFCDASFSMCRAEENFSQQNKIVDLTAANSQSENFQEIWLQVQEVRRRNELSNGAE
jgi:hypothetical protein